MATTQFLDKPWQTMINHYNYKPYSSCWNHHFWWLDHNPCCFKIFHSGIHRLPRPSQAPGCPSNCYAWTLQEKLGCEWCRGVVERLGCREFLKDWGVVSGWENTNMGCIEVSLIYPSLRKLRNTNFHQFSISAVCKALPHISRNLIPIDPFKSSSTPRKHPRTIQEYGYYMILYHVSPISKPAYIFTSLPVLHSL
jgi:hypothetical protein